MPLDHKVRGGDDPMGSSPPTQPASYESSHGPDAPYPTALPEDSGLGQGRASGSGEGDQQALRTPVPYSEIVVFRKSVPACDDRTADRAGKCYIYDHIEATCIDFMGPTLLKYFVNKVSETAKHHMKWDNYTEDEKQREADKGMQRRGCKRSSAPWRIADGPPEYEPHTKTEIEKMVSNLLEFSYDCCHLPDSYWLTPTARANAGVQVAKDPGDFR